MPKVEDESHRLPTKSDTCFQEGVRFQQIPDASCDGNIYQAISHEMWPCFTYDVGKESIHSAHLPG